MCHIYPQRIPHLNKKCVVKVVAGRFLDGEQVSALCIGLGYIGEYPTGIAGDFGGGTKPFHLG
jgi:hypothetical protein